MSIVTLPHDEVDRLWFGGFDFDPEKPFPTEAFSRWFRKSEEFDKKCRPFESLIYKIVELSAPALLALASSPEESLTLLLLLDQFSRNIMRGKAVHWVYTTADPTALHVAHHCLRQGYDSALPPHKKFWFYLVLSHSESMLDQEMALAKAANLACDVHFGPWKAWHPAFKDILGHTIKYYTTIDKFGRFPHRNAFLERETTDEEQQFLKEGNP